MCQQYVVHDNLELKWLECYNFSTLCFTVMYVVIICDAYIVLGEILGTQNGIFFLSIIEGIEVIINSIDDDVW